MRFPGIVIASRTESEFFALPPLTHKMTAYWTARYGVYTDDAQTEAGDTDAAEEWQTRIGDYMVGQTTGANQPELRLDRVNGLPSLYFGGASTYLSRDPILAADPTDGYTFMVGFRADDPSPATPQVILQNRSSSTNRAMMGTTSGVLGASHWDGSIQGAREFAVTAGNVYLAIYTHKAGVGELWVNGTEGGAGSLHTSNGNAFSLGGRGDGLNIFAGDILDAGIFPEVISTADRDAQFAYFESQYGVSMP